MNTSSHDTILGVQSVLADLWETATPIQRCAIETAERELDMIDNTIGGMGQSMIYWFRKAYKAEGRLNRLTQSNQ